MAISTLLISFASSLEMSRWRAFSKLMTTWTDSRESIPIYENLELLVISFGSHFEFSLITEIIFFSTSSSNTLWFWLDKDAKGNLTLENRTLWGTPLVKKFINMVLKALVARRQTSSATLFVAGVARRPQDFRLVLQSLYFRAKCVTPRVSTTRAFNISKG